MKVIEISKIKNFGWNFTDEYLKKIYIFYLYSISGRTPHITKYKDLQADLDEFVNAVSIPKEYKSTFNSKTLRQMSVMEEYGIINLNTFADVKGWDNVYGNLFTDLGKAFAHYCKTRIDLIYNIKENKFNEKEQHLIIKELDHALADFIVIFLSNLVLSEEHREYLDLYSTLIVAMEKYGKVEEDMFYLIATEIKENTKQKDILDDLELLKNGKLELRANKITNNAWNYSTNDLVRGEILNKVKEECTYLIPSENENYFKFKEIMINGK